SLGRRHERQRKTHSLDLAFLHFLSVFFFFFLFFFLFFSLFLLSFLCVVVLHALLMESMLSLQTVMYVNESRQISFSFSASSFRVSAHSLIFLAIFGSMYGFILGNMCVYPIDVWEIEQRWTR